MAERKSGIAEIRKADEIKNLLRETKWLAQRALTPEGQAKVKEYRNKITALSLDDLQARFTV